MFVSPPVSLAHDIGLSISLSRTTRDPNQLRLFASFSLLLLHSPRGDRRRLTRTAVTTTAVRATTLAALAIWVQGRKVVEIKRSFHACRVTEGIRIARYKSLRIHCEGNKIHTYCSSNHCIDPQSVSWHKYYATTLLVSRNSCKLIVWLIVPDCSKPAFLDRSMMDDYDETIQNDLKSKQDDVEAKHNNIEDEHEEKFKTTVEFTHSELVKLTRDAINKIIESDPIFSGIPVDATLEELKSQSAVAQGQAITLYLNRGGMPKVSVVVPPHNTTVLDLKKAIKRHTILALKRENVTKKISWKHVWKKYHVCFGTTRLCDDNENIKAYGLTNKSELHYVKKRREKNKV